MTDKAPAALAETTRSDRPLFGILCINGAVAVFVIMDAVIKAVSDTIPTGEIVFFRNLFAFVPILAFMLRSGGISLRTRDPLGHLLRGVFGVGAIFCYFLSYKLLPLSEAIALGLSIPIFLTLLSIPLLGEQVGPRRWAACIAGFIGVLVMTRPDTLIGGGAWRPAVLLPLAGALSYALAMISVRRLTATEQSGTIVFYFTLFATCAALATAPLGWVSPDLAPYFGWVWPAAADWPYAVAIGLLGGCAQILLTLAYRHAAASLVAPFEYMALIYGFLLGFAVFGERPDRYLVLGGALVVGSGLYILRRETRRRPSEAGPPPA